MNRRDLWGSFVALALGVALFATAALCVAAAIDAPGRPGDWFPDDPGFSRDDGLLVGTASLVGSVAGLAAVIAAMVVAGAFASSVDRRRREFGLLRAVGATPRQVRRLVLREALLVGGPAGVAGCALSFVLAPVFAAWLARNGLAPAGFRTGFTWWAPAAAFGLGLIVAVCGAWTAARRAARVRPIEALRVAPPGRRGVGRLLAGAACLGGVVPMAPLLATPEGSAYLLIVVLLLSLGCTLLLPVLLRPFTWAPTRGRGTIAMLARAAVRTSGPRYAATTAPVLLTIALAGATLAGTSTIGAAQAAGLRAEITAPLVVTRSTGALDRPGVGSAARTRATTVHLGDRQPAAWYVDGPAMSAVLKRPPLAGALAELTGDTVALSETLGRRVGDRVGLRLGDGARVTPRVVAVLDDRLGLPAVLLPWSLTASHTVDARPDATYLTLRPGADPGEVATEIRRGGGTVATTSAHLATLDAEFDRLSRLSLLAVLGLALVYTAIAIANTQLMATTARVRELLTLRLAGATRRQVLRLVGREALTVAVAGALLGLLITGLTLLTVRLALHTVTDTVPIRVPWPMLAATIAACALITVTASVAPAGRALGRPIAR